MSLPILGSHKFGLANENEMGKEGKNRVYNDMVEKKRS
jgi:hypothetical protein